MNRVYLASRSAEKPRMREIAAMLQKVGCTIVSSWIYSPGAADGTDLADVRYWAVRDEQEVRECDMCIVFADEGARRQGRGGRHTELGIARALAKQIIAVGQPEQIFHYLPGIVWVPDVAGLVQYIEDCQYAAWLVER